ADASRAWSALLREQARLSAAGDVSDRIDFLGHQLAELEREALEPDDIAELVAGHRRQAHAAELVEACDAAPAGLGGEDGSLRGLLARMQAHEPRLGEVDALLEAAAIQLDEAAVLLDRVRADLELDPARMEEQEQRLSRLHDLARKHRVPLEGLAAQRDALAAELEDLAGSAERLAALDGEIAAGAAAWRTAAAALGKARARAAKALGEATTALIGELGMGGGRFEVALEP